MCDGIYGTCTQMRACKMAELVFLKAQTGRMCAYSIKDTSFDSVIPFYNGNEIESYVM
jgi:hypothetical protein